MRIAIVDDISEERTLLRTRLESQFSRRNVHIDIFEYEKGETFLTAAKGMSVHCSVSGYLYEWF